MIELDHQFNFDARRDQKKLDPRVKTIVAWDLGATKCIMGLVEYQPVTQTLVCHKHHTVKLAETSSLEDLIQQLESGLDFSMRRADAICIGAAGHYDGQQLLHTNAYPYPMHFADTAKQQDWPAYSVIHDYAPIVCATFTSYMDQPANVKRLNTCAMQTYGRRVALGIGTGLGLKDGVLFANGDFWLGQNEAGHIGVTAPPTADFFHLDRHREIMRFLHEKFSLQLNQPITYEHILTGKGTVNLYDFFYPGTEDITPEQVGVKMREGLASELLDAFAWYLGLFIGTMQLIFMPEGGIWVTGGVAINHLDIFDRPDFFAGIYATPAYLMQRENYPLGVLCNHEHALIGSGYYAVKRLMS
jgi:glucokinase